MRPSKAKWKIESCEFVSKGHCVYGIGKITDLLQPHHRPRDRLVVEQEAAEEQGE